MQQIALQRKGKVFHPFSKEDEERMMEYPENQIINAKTTGVTIPRSYEQLKLYFACCQKVAENTDDPSWNTKENVDFQCRIACRIIDKMLVVNGIVNIIPGSIGYNNLSHLQACNYFDRAFEIMAKKLGITAKELTDEGKLGV